MWDGQRAGGGEAPKLRARGGALAGAGAEREGVEAVEGGGAGQEFLHLKGKTSCLHRRPKFEPPSLRGVAEILEGQGSRLGPGPGPRAPKKL